jgi:hypothetical protein
VPLLAIAAAQRRPLRGVFWITSAIFVLNLYVFYGLSRGWPPLIDRGWTFVDLSVVIAVANVAAFVWSSRRIWQVTQERGEPGRNERHGRGARAVL